MHRRRSVRLAAIVVALLPTSAFAASGMVTCAVDPFSKDGVTAKQQITISYEGDGPSTAVTVQSPWGTFTYNDAILTGEPGELSVVFGGERPALMPDFAGMEACLAKSTPDQLHDLDSLRQLVSDCGHTLAIGAEPVATQTLFGISVAAGVAALSLSLSYAQFSDVAGDQLEFQQSADCKPL